MRGRFQAALVATIAAATPMFFWLGAAAVVLVTLRKGWLEGINLTLWAALPATAWLVMQGNPISLVVLLIAFAMAAVLRNTVSWVPTLMTGVVMGLGLYWLMPQFVTELSDPDVLKQLAPNAGFDDEQIDIFGRLLTGLWSTAYLLVAVLSLILGRWWQSQLFNPGGFAEEFRQLIFPPTVAVAIVVIAQFGGNLHPALIGWAPIVSLPLFFAGIALAHGVVNIKKLGSQWLVLMYLLVFLVGPYLALVDSLMNFRRRLKKTPD